MYLPAKDNSLWDGPTATCVASLSGAGQELCYALQHSIPTNSAKLDANDIPYSGPLQTRSDTTQMPQSTR